MKKYVIVRKGAYPNDYFLKKLGKALKKATRAVGNVVKDSVKLGIAPIKQGIGSITGKKSTTHFSTGIGKTIGSIQQTGSNALHSTLKGFADTVTGGYASKAANVFRSKANREKAYSYNEMKSKNVSGKTGIKLLDKTAVILPSVGAAAGGIYAGATGASALGDLVSGGSSGNTGVGGNLKLENVAVGQNVLDQQLPLPNDNGLPYGNSGLPYPAGTEPNMLDKIKTASAGFGEGSNIWIMAIVLLIIISIGFSVNKKPA